MSGRRLHDRREVTACAKVWRREKRWRQPIAPTGGGGHDSGVRRPWSLVLVLTISLLAATCGGDDGGSGSGGTGPTSAGPPVDCPTADDVRTALLLNGANGVRPGAEVSDVVGTGLQVTYHGTDGSDQVITYRDWTAATEQLARDCLEGKTTVDLPLRSPTPEREPDCKTPTQVRRSLLSGGGPNGRATYFNADDVEEQGIPGGRGYVVVLYDDHGHPYILLPSRAHGHYNTADPHDLVGFSDDATFTREQFEKYSKHEASRCRREA